MSFFWPISPLSVSVVMNPWPSLSYTLKASFNSFFIVSMSGSSTRKVAHSWQNSPGHQFKLQSINLKYLKPKYSHRIGVFPGLSTHQTRSRQNRPHQPHGGAQPAPLQMAWRPFLDPLCFQHFHFSEHFKTIICLWCSMLKVSICECLKPIALMMSPRSSPERNSCFFVSNRSKHTWTRANNKTPSTEHSCWSQERLSKQIWRFSMVP